MRQEKMKSFIIYTLFALSAAAWIFFLLRFILPATLPFWLGLLIAFLLRPVILLFSQKLHLRRRKAAMFVTLLFYAVLAILCWILLHLFWGQICALAASFPQLYKTSFLPALARFFEWLSDILTRFVPNLADSVHLWMQHFASASARLSSAVSSALLSFCTDAAAKIPVWFFTVVVTILCSAFISLDYPKVSGFLLKCLPKRFHVLVSDLKTFIFSTLSKILRAYFLLLVITFAELSIGLWILKIRHFLSIAALIALLDLLPVIGTGTVLIPWAILSLLSGEPTRGVGILILYLVITVARNFLEPKIVGDSIGLHPLLSLVSIYAGLRWFGVLGALLMPCTVLTVLFLYKKYRAIPSKEQPE